MGNLIIINYDGTAIELGGSEYPFAIVTGGTQKQTWQAADELEIKVQSNTYLPIKIGAFCVMYGRPYILNNKPQVEQFATNSFVYTYKMGGFNTCLQRVLLLNSFNNEIEFSLVGTITDFISLITYNMGRTGDPRIQLIFDTTDKPADTKTISFNSDNCLTALQKIMDTFHTRYRTDVRHDISGIYEVKYILQFSEPKLKYWEAWSLEGELVTGIKSIPEANRKFATVLYPFGSDRNIPVNYLNYQRRLKPTGSDGTVEIEFTADLTTVQGSNNVQAEETVNGYKVDDLIYGHPGIINGSRIVYVMYPNLFVINSNAFSTVNAAPATIKRMGKGGDTVRDNDLVDLYGVYEQAEIIDSIYPHRTGTVTGLSLESMSVTVYLNYEEGSNRVGMGDPDEYTYYRVGDKLTNAQQCIPDNTIIQEVHETYLIVSNNALDTLMYQATNLTRTGGAGCGFIDADMSFDLNATDANGTLYLIAGVQAKVSFLTGNLAGYSFALKKYVHATKYFEIIPVTDDRGLTMPTGAIFNIQVGDTYVLTDINLPQAYINTAQQELRDYAEDTLYPVLSAINNTAEVTLNDIRLKELFYSSSKLNYFATDDPNYPHPTLIERDLNHVIECGFLVQVGSNQLGIGTLLITGVERDIIQPFKYKVTVGINKYTNLQLTILRQQDQLQSHSRLNTVNKREQQTTLKYLQQ